LALIAKEHDPAVKTVMSRMSREQIEPAIVVVVDPTAGAPILGVGTDRRAHISCETPIAIVAEQADALARAAGFDPGASDGQVDVSIASVVAPGRREVGRHIGHDVSSGNFGKRGIDFQMRNAARHRPGAVCEHCVVVTRAAGLDVSQSKNGVCLACDRHYAKAPLVSDRRPRAGGDNL